MKASVSERVVRALEDEGARFVFGVPGPATRDLYDALERSNVRAVPVLDERSGAFMAGGVSRLGPGVGVLAPAPGAASLNVLPGLAQAWMDNVPLVVLLCGPSPGEARAYRLDDIDPARTSSPMVKEVLRPEGLEDVYPTVRWAVRLARSGRPGPVAVEIARELFGAGRASAALREPDPEPEPPPVIDEDLEAAAELLARAKRPLLYVGRGALGAEDWLVGLAEALEAPVATTLGGKGVFPEDHPLWLWNGLGREAPAFVKRIQKEADAMLAIGCRFGETALSAYGFHPPENLIHVDVDPEVPNRNFPAALAALADARRFIEDLMEKLEMREGDAELRRAIQEGHRAVRRSQERGGDGGVRPAGLFAAFEEIAPEAVYAADPGRPLFLAVEHLRFRASGRLIGPVDFSVEGAAIPAALGAKLARPEADVVALVGPGALPLGGLELATGCAAPVVCVLRDAAREAPAGDLDGETFANLVGAEFMRTGIDSDAEFAVRAALETARRGRPALLEVQLDAATKTYFSHGAADTHAGRVDWGERMRRLGRFVARP